MRLNYGAFLMSVNGEPTQFSHAFVKKMMVRYMRLHRRFAHCLCGTPFWPLVSKYTISTLGSELKCPNSPGKKRLNSLDVTQENKHLIKRYCYR